MGLLTDDLMEQELTCGSFYKCTDIYTPHQSFGTLGGHGSGLFLMKIGNPRKPAVCKLVEELPVISDSKGRIRLEHEALIEFVCGCFRADIAADLRKSKCEVSISSTQWNVYYNISTDYKFDDDYNGLEAMRITLKKKIDPH